MQDDAADAELAADIAARGLLQNLVAKVVQVTFALDPRLGKRAGFRRNEQMLSLKPRYLVAFAGSGVLERLVVQAKQQGVAVVDRRGPLAINPKRAVRELAEAA